MSRAGRWGAIAACIGLTSCIPTLVDNPSRDVRKAVPASFRRDDAAASAAADAGVPPEAWSALFKTPELRSLIEQALKNNQELNIRMQEIIIAQAEVGARRGEYLPKVSAGVGVGVEKVGGVTSQGYSDKATGVPEHLGNFTFGLAATWEVDVWGRLRNAAKSADFRVQASIEGRHFLVTQLVAEISRSYFELVALDAELEVLESNIKIQSDALEVVRSEMQAARVTQLAVLRFEAEVLRNRSRLFALEQQRVQTENRINFLVGRYPQPVARSNLALTSTLPPELGGGLPSQLLENRPDLRQAERELEASKLDVRVAKARFYPALSIDAAVGYRSFNLEHLVSTPESLLYNLAGNLVAPLLNRAAIEAEYRTANAKQIQAVFNYEKTLLQAYTDVASLLVGYANLQKGYELQSHQVEKLAESVEVSTMLFQAARADYMEVLLTRRDSLDAQLELVETRKNQLLSMVGLYQALGGGWRPTP
ncbi:MAG: efflux transporter outer membrane subunit [Archangium sp.]|nr:efflux transporter outer membrane subunit [Archangium sp.]